MGHKFRDPLYGFIAVNDLEYAVIRSRWFQRLRRIKQLGFTNLTYPSAEHTRFEHSLGVMEVATRIFEALLQKEVSLKRLRNNKKACDQIRQLLRLAALLHDIGHPPFSHAGEELLPTNPSTRKSYSHEDYSRAIISTMIKERVLSKTIGNNIIALFQGKKQFYGLKCIVSSQFDADRMDYLFRDSHHLGVNYGVFDLPMLIQSLTLQETKKGLELAIEEEGVHVAEGMILARYFMFSQVYYHENNRAFEILLRQFLNAILPEGTFPPPHTTASLEAFYQWDDWRIQAYLYDPHFHRYGEVFLLRKRPYQKLYETPVLYLHEHGKKQTQTAQAEKYFHQITKALTRETIPYETDEAEKSIYQFERDNLQVKTKQGFVPLSQLSNIIRELPKKMLQKRIYVAQHHFAKGTQIVKGILSS